MGLWNRVRKSWSALTSSGTIGSWSSVGALGLDRADAFVSPYAQNATVNAGVRALARAVASATFRIYDGDLSAMEEGKPAPDGDDDVRLWAHPDFRHDGQTWWAEAMTWTALEGEFFGVAFADGSRFAGPNDTIREMLLVSPRCVQEDVDARTDRVTSWRVSDGTRYLTIPAESMWQFATFSPVSRHRGMSALQAGLLGMQSAYRGGQYVRALAQNESLPGLLIRHPDKYDAARIKEMREAWEERHRGAAKAGRLAMMSNLFEAVPLERQSFKEMGLEVLSTRSDAEIRGLLGITAWDVGDVDKVTTYAGTAVLDAYKWTNTILPWMRAVESSLRGFMGDRWERGRRVRWGAFDTADVQALQLSLGDRLDNARKLMDLGYGLNEVNAKLGLGMEDVPVAADAANAFDGAANGAQLTALVSVGEASAAGRITPEQAEAIIAATIPNVPEELRSGIAGNGVTAPQPAAPTPPPAEPVAKALDTDADREVYAALGRAFGQMRAEVIARVRSANPADYAEVKAAKPIADLVGGSDLWRLAMRTQIGPAVTKVTRIVARDAGLEMEASVRWDSPAFRKAASKRVAQMVDLAPKYRTRLAKRIVSTIRANGFDVRAVEDMIEAEFGQYVTSNAETIARTEVGMLREGIRYVVAQDAGYQSKVWQTILDGSERPSHAETHAERVGIAERFSNGLAYPLEVGAPADEVINCRCRARYQKRAP